MNCPHCGAEVVAGNRFCQQCRKRVVADAAPAAPGLPPAAGAPRPVRPPLRPAPAEFARPTVITVLAVLNLCGGALLLVFGALSAFALSSGSDRLSLPVVLLIAGLYLAVGALQLATGVGLLKLQPWGRTLQIVGAVIGLLGIPCGTIISILVLLYMLKPEVKTLFSGIPPRRLPPDEVARVQALSGGSAVMVVVGVAVAGILAVFMIGVVAAIAIPSLLRARVSANEAAAIGDLRTMVSAQAAYASANGGLGDTPECLAAPTRCIPGYPATGPVFLDPSLLARTRHGYSFEFVPGTKASAEKLVSGGVSPSSVEEWFYVATPITAGQTGTRTFCAEMSGLICASPGGRSAERDAGCPADCTALR